MVDRTGFEPVTSSMSLKRSNRAELTVHDIDNYTIFVFKWNFVFRYGKAPLTKCLVGPWYYSHLLRIRDPWLGRPESYLEQSF